MKKKLIILKTSLEFIPRCIYFYYIAFLLQLYQIKTESCKISI